ncbi:hypothetical protein BH23BAC1_BH23BAC1_15670 [soil metagenome]
MIGNAVGNDIKFSFNGSYVINQISKVEKFFIYHSYNLMRSLENIL